MIVIPKDVPNIEIIKKVKELEHYSVQNQEKYLFYKDKTMSK